MVELGNGAGRPLETPLGMTEIAHYVSIFPSALLSTWTSEVTWSRRTIMNATQSVNWKRTFLSLQMMITEFPNTKEVYVAYISQEISSVISDL